MLALLRAETLKLHRSLALLLCFAAPACVAAFAALALATAPGAKTWDRRLDEGLAMWSFFMLPMAVTALTILVAQIEHGPRMWNHLLVLPVRRSRLFMAKTMVVAGLLIAMQFQVYAGLYLAGWLVEAILPSHHLNGPMQARDMAVGLAAMGIGALAMLIVQLWAALRFRSFVIPLVIGIVGTFAALVITASGSDVYLPWLLPVYATMWPRPSGQYGVVLGLTGGLVALAAMLIDLGRREHP
ncbi:MAG: ABC transporter permease [Sphingomicrobium sp.]